MKWTLPHYNDFNWKISEFFSGFLPKTLIKSITNREDEKDEKI
jgi:hypothetical protein